MQIFLTPEERLTILNAMQCMSEHLQYEDEMSEEEKMQAQERYDKVKVAVDVF